MKKKPPFSYCFNEYGMRAKPLMHFFLPNRLLVACGEFNHTVNHTTRKNRVTCQKCLKAI